MSGSQPIKGPQRLELDTPIRRRERGERGRGEGEEREYGETEGGRVGQRGDGRF